MSDLTAEYFVECNYHSRIDLSSDKLVEDSTGRIVSFEEIAEAYYLAKSKANGQIESTSSLPIGDVSDSALCECRKEWMGHATEYNVHPYGNNIRYDKCQKCGKKQNFEVF